MIHTDEDDEFARIERENSMKGQPYNWEANAIKAAIRLEREACARIADEWAVGWFHPSTVIAEAIRARGQALREHAMYEVQRLGQEVQPDDFNEVEKLSNLGKQILKGLK